MLTIRGVTARTGLSAHTLRYYERIGLIDGIARDAAGQRRYRDADLAWLDFLLRLRSTGMGIAEMQRYAALRREGETRHSLSARRDLLETHAQGVAAEIDRLSEQLAYLQGKIAAYREMERQLDPD